MTEPKSIGIIMDGNRRWAKEHGLDPWEGHRKGAETLKAIIDAAHAKGVEHLIFYTLSTENWGRDPREIEFLLALLKEFFHSYIDEAVEKDIRVKVAGQKERFPSDIQEIFAELESRTEGGNKGTVWFALSYGGRPEILRAVNELIAEGKNTVDEPTFSQKLWTAGMPDPDIIIRTGGEKRLSNFLPWQSVYSELFFIDTYWPDFSKADFDGIIEAYTSRERRKGK